MLELLKKTLYKNENDLSKIVVDLSIKIHRSPGPGLLGSVYEKVLCYELKMANLRFERQKGIKVMYGDVRIDLGFRADLIVENKVLVEMKSIETVLPVHQKIVLTYLRQTQLKLGLLINFHEESWSRTELNE